MKAFSKKILILLLVPFLTSCIDLNYEVSIKDGGSGVSKVNIKVDPVLISLLGLQSKYEKLNAFLTEKEIKAKLPKDFSLLSYSRVENQDGTFNVIFSFSFNNLNSFSSVDFTDMGFQILSKDSIKYSSANGLDALFMSIYPGSESQTFKDITKDIAPSQFETAKNLFNANSVTIKINTPRAIKSNSIGVLSADKKSLNMNITLDKFLEKEKILLNLSW